MMNCTETNPPRPTLCTKCWQTDAQSHTRMHVHAVIGTHISLYKNNIQTTGVYPQLQIALNIYA